MALNDRTALKASIADWLNRADLTTVIDDFIALVEAEVGRILKGRALTTTTGVTFDTSGAVSLPSDFVRAKALTLETDLYSWPVEFKPYEYLIQKRGQLVNGPPRYVCVVGDQMLFAPISDSDTAYTGTLVYDATVAPLTSTNTTNWLLTSHPDVYLFGSLYQSAPYLKDDERIPVWEQKYRVALDQIRVLAQDSEYGGTPIVRPVSALGS